MDELILRIPQKSDIAELDRFREELLSAGGCIEGCGHLDRYSAADWLEQHRLLSDPITCPPDHVVSTQFVCRRKSDHKLVGLIQVRHEFNDYLEQYAGLIGYCVRPSLRRRGYGGKMLKKVLPFCKKIGLDRVLICCEVSNEASRRTILSTGGVFENAAYSPEEDIHLERYWVHTHGDFKSLEEA